MSLTVKELKTKRLPPSFGREHEHRLPAAQSTVYENLLRLCDALEDDRLKGVDPGLRRSVATLVAAMGREPLMRLGREDAEERSAELLAPENGRLRQQLTSTYRSMEPGDPKNARQAAEARELMQYVGAGLGIEAPELEITDAQRADVRTVEAQTGEAWRDFRTQKLRMAAAKLMVTEQLKQDAARKELPPETIEARMHQLAASGTFQTMCDRLPEDELRKTVEAKDGMKLVGAFASEIERERHTEKSAEPGREVAQDGPQLMR